MSSGDESLSGCGSFLCIQGVSPVVPVVEASFNLCPVLPVNGLLEDKTKVHVAGVPLSSVIDCRLVVPFGCDVV